VEKIREDSRKELQLTNLERKREEYCSPKIQRGQKKKSAVEKPRKD